MMMISFMSSLCPFGFACSFGAGRFSRMKPKSAPFSFLLSSPETGTVYTLHVVAPDRRRTPGPWTTVLFMDGDDQFRFAVDAYRALRRARAVPPLLLVGVGYGASYREPANKRGRDYTPTAHSDEPSSGRADHFLRFLRRTLWPALRQRYPVRADRRGIAGHSLGSLLVLHALFRAPRFFTHYLASAPSIWWDNRSLLRIVQRSRPSPRVPAARLFLCVGEKDSESMLGDLALFENWLARHPPRRLTVSSRRFPQRNHYDVLPLAFRSGLEALFAHAATGARK